MSAIVAFDTSGWQRGSQRQSVGQTQWRSRRRGVWGAAWGGLACLMVVCLETVGLAAPRPPTEVVARDYPNDAGTAIEVQWGLSPDDVKGAKPKRVLRYDIQRRQQPPLTRAQIEAEAKRAKQEAENAKKGAKAKPPAEKVNPFEFRKIGEATSQATVYLDEKDCEREAFYFYRVAAVGLEGEASAFVETQEPVQPILQWFKRNRLSYGIILVTVCGCVLGSIAWAQSGRPMWFRKIPGLEAIDEAVGRATEMGKKCLFVTGVSDIDEVGTLAGLTMLSRVARVAAEYDCRVDVPTARSLVMTAARETVQASYLEAGRGDAYHEDDVHFVTDDQFGFAAAITGTMVREKPAACFYFGQFYAESLYLAETGNSVGAIQIAGTSESAQ